MTKKDFEAIARAINGAQCATRDQTTPETKAYAAAMNNTARIIARDIADVCAADNPRFNRARFLRACGIEE